MENIPNKVAGLVKKAVVLAGAVLVAGGVAGCQTTSTGASPSTTVYVPDSSPWRKAEEAKLGGCVNLNRPTWTGSENTIKRAVKKNGYCERNNGGIPFFNVDIIEKPKHGNLEITNYDNGKIKFIYTPDKNFEGIDTAIISAELNKPGKKIKVKQKNIFYVANFEYGKDINIK